MHPETCASRVKEPRFFIDDADAAQATVHRAGLEDYSAYFSPAPGQHLLFEASPQYFQQDTALEWLPGLASRPKVLFLLRDPARRLQSLFRYSKYALKRLPPDTGFSQWLITAQGQSEQEACRYQQRLRTWQEALGEQRLKVFVFEQLVREPAAHLVELSDWLGINPEFWRGFGYTQRNRTVDMRHPALHQLAANMGRFIPAALVARLLPLYYRINARPAPAPDPAELAALTALREQYQPHNDELARQFGLDLRCWQDQPG